MLKAQIEVWQQVHRHDGGLGEVLFKDVALDHVGPPAHAGPIGVSLGQFCHVLVVFNANGLGAKLPSRGNRDLSISRAKVVDEVFGGDACGIQHGGHHLIGGGHPDYILARLSNRWLVFVVAGIGQSRQDKQGESYLIWGLWESRQVAVVVCESGGGTRNRTEVHGFAGRCITTLPSRPQEGLERETSLELATSTLARLRSTN